VVINSKIYKECDLLNIMVLEYFNINDEIVRSSIVSISGATTIPEKSPIVVGGMAIQLYCTGDKDALRSTSDVDLLYLPNIYSFEDFSNGIGKKIIAPFEDTIYQAQLKKIKHRDKYVVKIMNGQGQQAKEMFHMHIDKSPFTSEPQLRELDENLASSAMIIANYDSPVFVPRIEYILARKINRLGRKLDKVSSLERSIYTNASQGKWAEVANVPLHPWLDFIVQQQNEITSEKNNNYRDYHVNKDLYDLCLLARQVEGKDGIFNRAFFLKAKDQVDKTLNSSLMNSQTR